MATEYEAELERALTAEIQKLEPNASKVTVSSDGQFAIYRGAGDRYQLRRLSTIARKFLQEGGDVSTIRGRLLE
jgi:hypothetical protein